MKYYDHMPNFRRVYDDVGLDKMKKIMKMIEEIRYMCYLIPYFEQGCVQITEIPYKYNAEYMRMFNLLVSQYGPIWYKNTLCLQFIAQLHMQILRRLYNVFCLQYSKFMAIHEENFGDPKQAFRGIVEDRNIEWDVFCFRKYYNEIKNPIVVERLLAQVFEVDANVARNVAYAVTIYDLGDYDVEFLTKAEMESFIKHFVEVGAAYSIDAEDNWDELYTF